MIHISIDREKYCSGCAVTGQNLVSRRSEHVQHCAMGLLYFRGSKKHWTLGICVGGGGGRLDFVNMLIIL
jgi:hypothetical protein